MNEIEKNQEQLPEPPRDAGISRREFVTAVGGVGAGMALGGLAIKSFMLPDQVMAIPASEGYLLVDLKRCAGCTSCMLACSLTHHGVSNPSLSRIQITQDPWGKFPADIQIAQCRQCPYPSCVDACPTGAMHADEETGVRTVDESKCIGCERCVNACPFTPSRALWNYQDQHAQKCDLCQGTEHWSGGGEQRACEAVCPMRAITFTDQIPSQSEDGYYVDLRTGTPWNKWGFDGAAESHGSH